MLNGESEDKLPALDSEGDAMPWRAEDLLRAVLTPNTDDDTGDSDPSAKHAPHAPHRGVLTPSARIERFLDALDGGNHNPGPERSPDQSGLSILTVADGERTIGFPVGHGIVAPVAVPHHALLAWIGRGGFGQVWLASHDLTEHYRACKLVPAAMMVELDGLRRLKQRVPSHPGLFPIEEVARVGGWLYILMPLADDAGETKPGSDPAGVQAYRPMTLKHRVASGPVPSIEAAAIASQLRDALAHLHQHGVTHGDIKPGNILRLGGRWTLADYGLARDAAGPVGPGHTPGYTPAEGPGTIDADHYALGVVMLVMLTGGSASDLRAFREKCIEGSPPPGLDARWIRLIIGLTSTDPGVRRRTAEGTADTLRALATPPRPVWKRAAEVAISVAALAAAGVVGVKLFIGFPSVPKQEWNTPRMFALWNSIELDRDVPQSLEIPKAEATLTLSDLSRDPGFLVRPLLVAKEELGAMITQDGRVVVWGLNRGIPRVVPEGIVNPVRISISGDTIMVLQADGKVVAWSQIPTEIGHTPPSDLPPAVDLVCIYQGAGLAVLADGNLAFWGQENPCSGPGSGVSEQIDGLSNIDRISGINAHVLLQSSDGTVFGAGCNVSGQLNIPNIALPVRDFHASESWSCILDADGVIHAMGFRSGSWLAPPPGDGFVQITTGNYFGLALHESGRIVHWGDNRFGQGNVPEGLEDVVSLVATGFIAAAVHSDGSMTVWGDARHRVNDWPSHERVRLGDPDLDHNGVPDWIDTLRGKVPGEHHGRVPDHAEPSET